MAQRELHHLRSGDTQPAPGVARQQYHLARPTGDAQQGTQPFDTIRVRVVDPNRYGGGNKHLIPDEVQRLARTLRRPATSLLYKMQNLLAHLPHGAKQEPALGEVREARRRARSA